MNVYNKIVQNKNKWVKLGGGISNEVYLFDFDDEKYVIKKLNRKNNGFFNYIENYMKYLINSKYFVHFDETNDIYIERFIEGDIINNDILYDMQFLTVICSEIDLINELSMNIPKENIILKYLNNFIQYLKSHNEFSKFVPYEKIIDEIIKNKSEYELVYNHNDVQKYNILIDDNSDKKIIILDFEYAGYSWKFFDHANFVVLLHIDMNIFHDINIDDYLFAICKRYNGCEYNLHTHLIDLMIIASYLWTMWAHVKYIITNDEFYLEYSNQLFNILKKLLKNYYK